MADLRGLQRLHVHAVASAVTHKTQPLVPDGAFMLGGEQVCAVLYSGGCNGHTMQTGRWEWPCSQHQR